MLLGPLNRDQSMEVRLLLYVAGLSLTGRVSARNGKACPSFAAKRDLNRDLDSMESFPLHYLLPQPTSPDHETSTRLR